jgi:hypothetical protein
MIKQNGPEGTTNPREKFASRLVKSVLWTIRSVAGIFPATCNAGKLTENDNELYTLDNNIDKARSDETMSDIWAAFQELFFQSRERYCMDDNGGKMERVVSLYTP